MSGLSLHGHQTPFHTADYLTAAPRSAVSSWVRKIIDHPEDLLFGLPLGRDADADRLLWSLARALRAENLCVEGFVQLRGSQKQGCRCREMHLVDLGTDARTRISEERGAGARGCHLDWAALTETAARLERSIAFETDLLLINRFGRAESEGAGMRGAISGALAQRTRVLVGYRPDYAEVWAAFHEGLARDLSA